MPNFTDHILTEGGQALIAQAHLGRKLTFTKISVGSGNVATPINATALAAHQMDVGITSIQRDATNANWVRVRGVFNNVSLTTGFNYREMGLFARIDSEPEVLYSYVADAGAGDLIPAYDGANPVIVYPTIIVIIESTIPIHADITIGADFECENIGPSTLEGWFAQKAGNTFQFKRPVQGVGIELIETAETITIGQRYLQVDIDLYVPLSHPAAPSPDVAFPTIQQALDYLHNISIPSGRLATINVAAGDYTLSAPIIVEHPDGLRIRIIGADPDVRNIIGSFTLQAGGQDRYTLDSAAGIGSHAIVRPGPAVADHYSNFGYRPITPQAGNLVDAWHPRYRAMVSGTTTAGGTMTFLRTLLRNFGVIIRKAGLGIINNIGLLGNGAGNALEFIADGLIGSNVGIYNFRYGIYGVTQGVLLTSSCAISGCTQRGVWLSSGTNLRFDGVATSNQAGGVYAFNFVVADCDGAFLCDNNGAGLEIFRANGSLFGGAAVSNNGRGISCTQGNVGAGNNFRLGNSGGADVFAEQLSWIGLIPWTTFGVITPVFNPPLGTWGNANAYING